MVHENEESHEDISRFEDVDIVSHVSTLGQRMKSRTQCTNYTTTLTDLPKAYPSSVIHIAILLLTQHTSGALYMEYAAINCSVHCLLAPFMMKSIPGHFTHAEFIVQQYAQTL